MGRASGGGRPKKKPLVEPDFLSAPELARRMGVSPDSIDRWMAKGAFPPPWVYLGTCRRAWRTDHYEAFRATGEWPSEAWKRWR